MGPPGPLRIIEGEEAMPGFVKLTTLDKLPPGSSREVEHEGRIYALFNVDGIVSAIDGICPHQGGPLAEGSVKKGILTCPWHGWQFELATGKSTINARIKQTIYEVKLEGTDVLVAVP